MHGNANSNIFETHLKSVMSPCDKKHKQVVTTLEVYLMISSLFLGTVSLSMTVRFMRHPNI